MGSGGLRVGGVADAADLGAFLGRVVRLDPAALVRLRGGAGGLTAFVRLPFGVLVSRTAVASEGPLDVTVGAGPLLAELGLVEAAGPVPLPVRQDAAWRGALPPVAGWEVLDRVPVGVVRQVVRAGAEALRTVGGQDGPAYGEALLDHESLTVSGPGRVVALPLRVLSALSRMGFLGPEEPAADSGQPAVVVAASGRWARLAAPYGSAYHQVTPALSLRPL